MIQFESASALHLDLYNYSCDDCSSAVKHNLNNKKFKYYKVEILLNYYLHQYVCSQLRIEYKIK